MSRPPPDQRTVILAKQINEIALSRGMSQNKLTDAAKIKPQQWSALLHGRSGIGDAKLHAVAAEIGAVLAIASPTEDRPSFIGTAIAGGRVLMSGTSKLLPALVAVNEVCGEYEPGDEVLIVEGGYAPGERLLLDGPEGLVFADAYQTGRAKKLRTLLGESFDFDPKLHRVVGVVDGFRRRRKRPSR